MYKGYPKFTPLARELSPLVERGTNSPECCVRSYNQYLCHKTFMKRSLPFKLTLISPLYICMCHSAPFLWLGEPSRMLILGVSCQFCLMNQSSRVLESHSISLSVPFFFLRLRMPLLQKLAIVKHSQNCSLKVIQPQSPPCSLLLSMRHSV